MKKILCLLVLLPFTACGGESASSSSNADKNGKFKATIGDKNYDVAVKCYHFDSDKFDTEFLYASDDGYGNKDNDGDGLIIRGDRINLTQPMKMDGMSLMIVDNGVEYETMPTALGKFEKTDKGITGTTKLYKAGTTTSTSVTYEVSCK